MIETELIEPNSTKAIFLGLVISALAFIILLTFKRGNLNANEMEAKEIKTTLKERIYIN